MEKNKNCKQWNFERNRIFGSWVMNFQSLINPCHRRSCSWQLHQYLWCHSGQLSIGFVHRISHFCIYMKFEIRDHHNSFRNTCRFYAPITYLKNKSEEILLFIKIEKMGNSVYKTYGELSTMTSQILTELPTQGSPMSKIH